MSQSHRPRPGSNDRETLEDSFESKDGFRDGWNVKGVDHVAEEFQKFGGNFPSSSN